VVFSAEVNGKSLDRVLAKVALPLLPRTEQDCGGETAVKLLKSMEETTRDSFETGHPDAGSARWNLRGLPQAEDTGDRER
jgi:hypothetical protein